MNIISQGAEAVISLEKGKIVKERVAKNYRILEIDVKLRKLRTRSEGKLLQKAEGIAPKVFEIDDKHMVLTLEHIDGQLLKDVIDSLPLPRRKQLLMQLGMHIARLHEQDIIHGDLTTSNILVQDSRLYLIDFGLGFISTKIEDKAVDLHLLKQALASKHYALSEEAFAHLLEGYAAYGEHGAVLQRLHKVEARGRHKQK